MAINLGNGEFSNFAEYYETLNQNAAWDSAQQTATDTYNTAAQYFTNLTDETVDSLNSIVDIDEYLGEVTRIVSDYSAPLAPVSEDIVTNFPTFDNTLETKPVDDLIVPLVPEFTDEAPAINVIDAPSKLTTQAPTATPIQEFAYPDTPNEELPLAPTLREITLPVAPDIIEVTFDALLPDNLEDAPDVTFNYLENDYSTSLLDEVNAKLLEYVSGFSTGLKPEVEQAIWDRGRDRTNAAADRAVVNQKRIWSASGWDIPGGDLVENISQAEQEAIQANITESRNIAVSQAELEQKNFQFSFTQAVQLESQLLTYSNSVNQRAFEAAKYVVQSAIDIYGLKVTGFNAKIQAYGIQASVYSDRIRAELSKVELFKALLDGQKLVSELNGQDIANYTAQISAVLALFELYKSELEGVKIKLDGERLKIQSFESEIKAFESEVRAKDTEYNGYKTANDAELVKVELFKSLSDVYKNKIDAYKTTVSAEVEKKNIELEVSQKVPVEVYKVESDAFKTAVDAESSRISTQLRELEVAAGIYDSKVKGEVSRVDAEVKVQKNEIDKLVAESNIRVESLKANVSKALSIAEIISTELQTGARVASQLAASAMSVINLSDSVSRSKSQSESTSNSTSSSISTSHSHIYNES